MTAAVEVRSLEKLFGRVRALDGLSLPLVLMLLAAVMIIAPRLVWLMSLCSLVPVLVMPRLFLTLPSSSMLVLLVV